MNKLCPFAAFLGLISVSATSFAIQATDPSPRYNFKHAEWWFGRFDRLRELAAKEGPSFKVAFIGDSLTENWEAPGTNVWNRTYVDPKYKAICLGFGGDRTENLLWRVENGQFDGLDPKVVVLLIGANNVFFRSEREEPPADTVRAVALAIRRIREKCPNARIVLNAILPTDERPDSERRLRGLRISEQLRMLADGERVLWCNFGAKLLESDGTLAKETAPDFTHPAEKGYVIWEETLRPYLDWCLGYSDERPQDVAGTVDGRSAFWRSALYAATRDAITANPEHYYDFAFIGGHDAQDSAATPRDEAVRGCKTLDFPFDFEPTVDETVWAVENAGLCDGYSTRFAVLSGDLWKTSLTRDGVEPTLAGIKRLVDAVRSRQQQAKIVLCPVPPSQAGAAEFNTALRGLADGDRVFIFERGNLFPAHADVAMPRPDSGWLSRYAMNRRQIETSGGQIDMVFLGDSITHYWDVGEGSDSSTEIEDLRKTYSILNCAYGGDWVQNRLWCVENGLFDGYRTKLVMIHIGTNNSGGKMDPQETFAGIKAIVKAVRVRQPQAKILLLDIFPRGTLDSPANVLNRKVNELINAEKWDDAVIVKDIGANFADEKGETIPELFDEERLHFIGTEGYARWRRAVEPIFKSVVGK